MSSSSFVRTTSLLASAVILAVAASALASAGDQPRAGDVEQAWFRLTEALDPLDAPQLRDRTDQLLAVAAGYDLKRLTPMALALIARSHAVPAAEAKELVAQAARLDPGSPEVWFTSATVSLRLGKVGPTVSSLARGVRALFEDRRAAPVVWPTLLLCLVAGFGAGVLLWSLAATRHVIPRLWHDILELGAAWRLGPNRYVLAILIVGLPVFAGGDPFWLLLWVFTLCWAYFGWGNKVLGALALVFAAGVPAVTEWAFRTLTHPPNVLYQAAAALDEHRYAPSVLDELASLSDVFAGDPGFFVLQGDCLRQFGLLEGAAQAYREGLQAAPTDGRVAFGLATIQYLQGDFNAALHDFQVARDAGFDPVIVNFDLSLTFAQTYHFHESDEAIAAARAAGESRLRSLTQGADHHQLLLAAFTPADVTRLLAQKDGMLLMNRGLLPPPLVRERTFAQPQGVGAAVALLVALLLFLTRQRFTGLASACIKCGRSFCRRCKLSQESQSYCTQCVNIFLKKDMVPIDTQMAKRRQLARRRVFRMIESRLSDVLLPGLGLSLAGRALLGVTLALVAIVSASLAFVWLPRFIAPALMNVSLWPLELLLGLLWLAALVAAQLVPAERG
jgi:tetratricopeptide (TPR) repeat protein